MTSYTFDYEGASGDPSMQEPPLEEGQHSPEALAVVAAVRAALPADIAYPKANVVQTLPMPRSG